MTTHIIRGCPYSTASDVWLFPPYEGVADLDCEVCLAIITRPVIDPSKGDDGRRSWFVEGERRRVVRRALRSLGYAKVGQSGYEFSTEHFMATYSETFDGPAGSVTVSWNGHSSEQATVA